MCQNLLSLGSYHHLITHYLLSYLYGVWISLTIFAHLAQSTSRTFVWIYIVILKIFFSLKKRKFTHIIITSYPMVHCNFGFLVNSWVPPAGHISSHIGNFCHIGVCVSKREPSKQEGTLTSVGHVVID